MTSGISRDRCLAWTDLLASVFWVAKLLLGRVCSSFTEVSVRGDPMMILFPYLEEGPGVNHLAHLLLRNGALSSSDDGEEKGVQGNLILEALERSIG